MKTKQQQQPTSSSHKENVPNGETTVAHEETYQKNWIIGGKYREQLYEEHSQEFDGKLVQEVDFDLPLTATKPSQHNGGNFIVLEFAEGDKENPFNWNSKYKAFISILLCAMTLFIGLATTFTTAYSQSEVSFNGTSGYGFVQFDPLGNPYYEIVSLVAVPEPSTWIAGALVLIVIGYSSRKRFVRRAAA